MQVQLLIARRELGDHDHEVRSEQDQQGHVQDYREHLRIVEIVRDSLEPFETEDVQHEQGGPDPRGGFMLGEVDRLESVDNQGRKTGDDVDDPTD